jgi:hypothetical protein
LDNLYLIIEIDFELGAIAGRAREGWAKVRKFTGKRIMRRGDDGIMGIVDEKEQ